MSLLDPFPHPTVGYLGCCAKTVFWEEGRPGDLQHKIIFFKKTPIFRLEALFNTDQCTDLHQMAAKKGDHIAAGERANSWNGRAGGKSYKLAPEGKKHPWSCGSAILQDKQDIYIAEHCHRIRISYFKSNHQLSSIFILSISALPWCSCSSSSS